MEKRLKVGITHGDINGVSYEMIIKMLTENRMNEFCTPVLYGSSKVAAYYRKSLDVSNFNLNSIQKVEDANEKRSNIINLSDEELKVEVGKETPESRKAAINVLLSALKDIERKELDVLVLAPQSNASYAEDGRDSAEFLAKKYQEDTMQVLIGEKMKMGFVTTHIPFNEITGHITTENILKKLLFLDKCLRVDFAIRKPRIGVLALNPESTEQGFAGVEEKEVILPAIEKARDKGVMALGPYGAGRLFTGNDYEKFDAILALHYDQGMVPFKAIEGEEGASLYAGLQHVITSPVSDPAYHIAGKGVADESGLRKAVYLGIDVFNNRSLYEKISARPLPHYDIGGNGNESDMNVEQIAGVKKDEF